jgi:hypothetical protein
MKAPDVPNETAESTAVARPTDFVANFTLSP